MEPTELSSIALERTTSPLRGPRGLLVRSPYGAQNLGHGLYFEHMLSWLATHNASWCDECTPESRISSASSSDQLCFNLPTHQKAFGYYSSSCCSIIPKSLYMLLEYVVSTHPSAIAIDWNFLKRLLSNYKDFHLKYHIPSRRLTVSRGILLLD